MHDYVAGKAEWGAAGLPLEGTVERRAGDLARTDVPTCSLGETVSAVRERAHSAGWDTCVVVGEGGIVLGRLGRQALAGADDARVEDVMTPGPTTVRPSLWLDALAKRFRDRDVRTALVTRSDGSLVGLVRREDVPIE